MVRTLEARGAIGAAAAVRQDVLADSCGISTRKLQDVTLDLNRRGVPVVSSCVEPFGVFLADSDEELAAYDRQLRARLVGNALRRGYVRRMLRQRIAARTVEPDGQGRLFA